MTDRQTHRPLLRAVAFLGAFLVAGIAAAAWLWRGGEVAPVAQAPVANEAPTPSETPAVVDVRTEAPPPPSEAETVRLRVLVQDRAKQPIAGAEITVTGEDDDLTFPPTGSDGWTQAPRLPNGDVNLKVVHGGRSGSASWRCTPTLAAEVTIWMNTDRNVEVTVIDGSGATHANVHVSLFGGRETEWRSPSQTAVTDDTGMARFTVQGHTWLAANEKVRAMTQFGRRTVLTDPVAWSTSGPTMLTLVGDHPAPVGQQLRVRFVGDDGAPIEVKGTLAWSRIENIGFAGTEMPEGEMAVAGRDALMTQLPENKRIRISLLEADRFPSRLEVTLVAGAQNHEAALARGPAAPRLEVPLIDRDGKAVTTGDFVVTVLLANGGYEDESTLQPDRDGNLVVTLAEAAAGSIEIAAKRDAATFHWPEAPRLERPYRTSIGREPPPNPPLAVMTFARCAAGERRRLSPVTAPDAAPRIVGVVLDVDGKPAPRVRIWMTTVTVPEPKPFAAFSTMTDANGRFTIRATSLPDEVFVCGRKPLAFCAPVRVRPSAEPVTLHLQPTGSIALDLRAPERPPLPQALVSQMRAIVALRIDDDALADGWWTFYRERTHLWEGQWRERWTSRAAVPDHGELLLRDLVPGVYRVLGNVGLNRVLDVPGVLVVAGETTRPPQAQGSVIGDAVELGCVNVRDNEGRPFAKARVRALVPSWETQNHETRETDANGQAWFVVPRGATAAVEVTAANSAPVKLPAATFPIEVTIGAGTTFDFVITGQAEAAKDSRALVVVCKQFDGQPPDSPVLKRADMVMFGHPQANLDDTGSCAIPNLSPGTWRLWLGAVPPIGIKRPHTFVLLGDRTITARDPERLIIEHTVTAEETATLLGK